VSGGEDCRVSLWKLEPSTGILTLVHTSYEQVGGSINSLVHFRSVDGQSE